MPFNVDPVSAITQISFFPSFSELVGHICCNAVQCLLVSRQRVHKVFGFVHVLFRLDLHGLDCFRLLLEIFLLC